MTSRDTDVGMPPGQAIERARVWLDFGLWAYVFMPEHAHLILWPRRPDSRIAPILKAIKQPVGQRGVAYLEAYAPRWLPRITRVRGGRTERLFWQSGGGYDRNLIETRTVAATIDYVHQNPVWRRLVLRAEEWRWSSAGWFEGRGRNPLRPDRIPRNGPSSESHGNRGLEGETTSHPAAKRVHCNASLDPGFPEVRVAFIVEHRQYNDSISPDPIKDRVRELPDERFADIPIDHGVHLGSC